MTNFAVKLPVKLRFLCLVAAIANSLAMADGITVQRPAAATQYLESTTADFGVWVDPATWKLNPHPVDLFNLEFIDVGRIAYAALHAERAIVPLDTLPAIALKGFRTRAGDIKIVTQENRFISGKEVLFLTFAGDFNNAPAIIYGCYYSGSEGTVELIVTVPAQFAGRYKTTMEDFLDGLQIGKPGETPPLANATPAQAGSTPAPGQDSGIDIAELNATVPYGDIDPIRFASQEILAGEQAEGASGLDAQAKKGDAKALALLAVCYDEGKGVPKDPAKALQLLTKAASVLPAAKEILGTWYDNGHNVPKDLKHAEKLFGEAASAGVPAGETSFGQMLYPTDPKAAAGWFQKAADQEYAKAEFYLAICYGDGGSVQKDLGDEIKWIQRASSHGYPPAQFIVAGWDWVGSVVPQNPEAAAGLFKILAISGTAAAQNDYGICLWTGSGVVMNRDEALRWYHKAADQGEPNAESFLGRVYCNGDGVPKNIDQGVAWYQKAANQGQAAAQYKMGIACLEGFSVAKNTALAMDWFQKAADQGNIRAEAQLGGIYLLGIDGVPPNPEESLKWAQKAADAGNSRGEYTLGKIYSEGKGVPVDAQKSYFWVQKAAAQGFSDAEFDIGIYILNGFGVEKNIEVAESWIRKAAIQDQPSAEFQLGLFYIDGRAGVTADHTEAVRWFRFSALQACPRGENAFGYALATGNGIPQDLVEAYKWFLLASSQDKDADAKRRATVNMLSILPKMTPDQIEEAKKRVKEFVPKHRDQPESLSIGVA
jgi:hypothetical protein